MSGTFDVVVTGLVVVDVLVRLPREVRRGEKHEVGELMITGGAPAGNAASVLGSLGWSVGYLARLGRDTMSGIARAELARCHVSEDLLIDDPDASPGVAIVEIDPANGDRTVFYNLSRYRFVQRADVSPEAIRAAKLVLVDGYETEAALAVLELARKFGVESVLDIEAGDPAVLRRLLELGTHAILPIEGARALAGKTEAGDILHALASLTKAQLVVTDGMRGAWALAPEGVLHQPAFPVEAVDTTGCGDAFHGAYASALLDGWPLPLRLEFAAFIASRVALEIGGRTRLPAFSALAAQDLSNLSPDLQSRIHAKAAESKKPF